MVQYNRLNRQTNSKKNCFQGYDYNRKTSKLFTWSISWSPTKMLLYNIVLVGDRTNLEFNFYRLWPSLNAFKIAPQYLKQLLIRCWIQRVKRSRKLKKKNQKNNASEIVRSLNTDMNYGFHLRLFTVCFNLSLADSLSNTSERESKFLAVYFWIRDSRFEIRICIQFTNDALYLSWNSKLSPSYKAFDLLFALILLHHLKLTPHPPQGQLKWQSASWKTEKS